MKTTSQRQSLAPTKLDEQYERIKRIKALKAEVKRLSAENEQLRRDFAASQSLRSQFRVMRPEGNE